MTQLKKIRNNASISQKRLSEKIGVSQGQIALLENGKRNFSLNVCWKIITALNELGTKCTFSDVFPNPTEIHHTVEQEKQVNHNILDK